MRRTGRERLGNVESIEQRTHQGVILRIGHGHARKIAKKQRHVGFGLLQQGEQVGEQGLVTLAVKRAQPQLGAEHAVRLGDKGISEHRQALLQRGRVVDERQQGVGEPHQIPLRDIGLVAVAIAPALAVGGVGRPAQIVALQPAVGAVVHGQPQYRHIVGVHHAMHKTHAHPAANHHRGTPADLLEPARINHGRGRPACGHQRREVRADDVVGQALEQRQLLICGKNLEIAETHKRRRNAANHGARFGLRVTVIEHVAHHHFAGGGQTERARARHAKVMHGFAAHVLAHRGAQHGAAVGGARIRRQPRALELQLVALGIGCDQLGQRDGAPVAKLPGPMPELVAAVARGIRPHARQHAVAAQHLGLKAAERIRTGDAQHVTHGAGPSQYLRRAHRRRLDAAVADLMHLARARAHIRVGGKRAHEAVLKGDIGKPGKAGGGQFPVAALVQSAFPLGGEAW